MLLMSKRRDRLIMKSKTMKKFRKRMREKDQPECW